MKGRIFLSILLGLLVVCGCSDEHAETPQPTSYPEFSLPRSSITAGYAAGSNDIGLVADQSITWTATCSADWLSVSPSSGTGGGRIYVTWQENTTASGRKATVTFSGGKTQLTLTVTQSQKAAELVSTRAIVGNLVKFETDSVEFVFDRPVGALRVSSNSELYAITTTPEKVDGEGLRWRLPLKVSNLGSDIQLAVAYKPTSDWKERTKGVTVPFYEKKYLLSEETGWVNYSTLSLDKGSIWLSTQNWDADMNKVVQVSLDDMTVMKSVKMPFAPQRLCMNPYNGLLYVMGNTNYFCVVDPAKGEIVKQIQIENSPYAHPQHPLNNADEVAFTKDGFGILRVTSSSSTSLEWRYIDSADDDKITLSGYDWTHQFERLYTNYDGTRIYANMYYRTYTTMEWVNREHKKPVEVKIDGHFNSDKQYAGGNLVDLQMSPFANKAFICTAPAGQCVVNLEPVSYSEVIEMESRASKCTWDEVMKERDYVYKVCTYDGFMELFDMTEGTTVFASNHGFISGTSNDAKICHFLPASDQLVVTSLKGVYVFDAAAMKAKI